ncbi:hypothetical protein P153DRAFT_227840 [Dothidotthia symphoricarpi CBS 119687]|uniref:Uncharacterized protein n=1 Tax=Dothidotthia symphoricarpi CBS 119687 TaxID=1392245 RepID=A0A6A6AFS3_9PLEO|nr:uncharacterized protein P153DRAFT_227840 [Dothidotthia symphoricarpi CBS 119687]KAF2129955.1 hypothetical protein P153DRAFT_227840 [Dothidotthia symphoricarpi CBS 119687]
MKCMLTVLLADKRSANLQCLTHSTCMLRYKYAVPNVSTTSSQHIKLIPYHHLITILSPTHQQTNNKPTKPTKQQPKQTMATHIFTPRVIRCGKPTKPSPRTHKRAKPNRTSSFIKLRAYRRVRAADVAVVDRTHLWREVRRGVVYVAYGEVEKEGGKKAAKKAAKKAQDKEKTRRWNCLGN